MFQIRSLGWLYYNFFTYASRIVTHSLRKVRPQGHRTPLNFRPSTAELSSGEEINLKESPSASDDTGRGLRPSPLGILRLVGIAKRDFSPGTTNEDAWDPLDGSMRDPGR